MSGLGNALAAVGGAANGADSAMRYYAGLDNKKQLQELKDNLQKILEEGRSARHEEDLTAREKALKAKTDAADADRAIHANDVAGRLTHLGQQDDLGWANYGMRYDLGQQGVDTTKRGQDLHEGDFWGGTVPLGYARDATTQRGQDIGAATSRDNAALGADVSQRNAELSSATTQRGQNMNYTRPRSNSLMDLLMMSQAPAGAPAQAPPPQPAPVPPATVTPPARVGPAPLPVRPRGASAAPAAPSGLVKGAAVTLKNGQKVTVDSVNPDGSFTYH